MHLAIRADGGPDIGFGHLVRSSAVAAVALEAGAQVTVATATPASARDVFPGGVDIYALPNRDDYTQFCSWLDQQPVDIVFADAYPVDTEYQRAVSERTGLVVQMDDTRHAVCADAVVNGNLYATGLEYDVVGDTPRWCLGPSYLLLRKEITSLQSETPPWRETPQRALVTMGGSDMANLTPTVLQAFETFDGWVDAIVGPGYSQTQASRVREVATAVSATVTVSRDPDDLPERMFEADIAVCTASSTTYELLALGTPFVCLPIVDNQRAIADALNERDLATVLSADADETAFRRGVQQYVRDRSLRRRRRDEGRALIDGRGVERVVDVLRDSVRS